MENCQQETQDEKSHLATQPVNYYMYGPAIHSLNNACICTYIL